MSGEKIPFKKSVLSGGVPFGGTRTIETTCARGNVIEVEFDDSERKTFVITRCKKRSCEPFSSDPKKIQGDRYTGSQGTFQAMISCADQLIDY